MLKYLNKFYLKHNEILIPKFTKQFYLALRLKNKKFPEGPLAGVKFTEEITLYWVRYDLTVVLHSCVILISFSFKGQ